jgi:hypothetical protein
MKETQLAQALGLYIGQQITTKYSDCKLCALLLGGDSYVIIYNYADLRVTIKIEDEWKLRLRPLSDMTVEEANQLGIKEKVKSVRYHKESEVLILNGDEFSYTITKRGDLHLFGMDFVKNLILELASMGFNLGLLPPERVELIELNK